MRHKPLQEAVMLTNNSASMSSRDRPWLASYPKSTPKMLQFNPVPLASYFDASCAKYPDQVCLRYAGLDLSYQEVAHLAAKAANGLVAMGLKHGDRLALCMPNHAAFVILYIAALKLGITLVPLNPLYAVDLLATQLRNTGARACATVDIPEIAAKVADAAAKADVAQTITCRMDASDLHGGSAVSASDESLKSSSIALAALIANNGIFTPAKINPATDLAALQSTGGTTGIPKCAMLTHENFFWNIEQMKAWLPQLKPGVENFLVPLPMFHITGTTTLMHFGLALGASLTLLPRFEIQSAVRLCKEHDITLIAGVPTIFTALLGEPSAAEIDWSKLKHAISGGGPLPTEVKKRFGQTFGVNLMQGYGLSETAPVIVMTPTTGPVPDGSIGLPVMNTHIEIRDLEDPSRRVANGERGELCVSGPQVMKGYWEQPEETANAMTPDGLFRTGDIAIMDEAGFLEIVDRLKDMIIAGGYNIYPTTVEAAIYQHADVAECIVIGIPDGYRGETVKAFIQLRKSVVPDIDGLKAFLQSRLSPMEVPKHFEFRHELPKTAVGKLSRLQLRQEEQAKRGAHV
jgi:long-chain acyl-CoA synthetase